MATHSATDGLSTEAGGLTTVSLPDADFASMVFALIALVLEVIGLMSVSVSAAMWYLELGVVRNNLLAILGYFLTMLLPMIAILNLVSLTFHNQWRARAFRRLQENGVLLFSDESKLSQKVIGIVFGMLAGHTVLVGIASVLHHKDGGIGLFETFARWGAVCTVGALLVILAWELTSAKVVLLDFASAKSMREDGALLEFAHVLNAMVPVHERTIVTFLRYVKLLTAEVGARKKAEKKSPCTWSQPLDEANIPKIAFATILHESTARTSDAIIDELCTALEASALSRAQITKLINAQHSQGLTVSFVLHIFPIVVSEWEDAVKLAGGPRDASFVKTMKRASSVTAVALLACFAMSFAWYVSEFISIL